MENLTTPVPDITQEQSPVTEQAEQTEQTEQAEQVVSDTPEDTIKSKSEEKLTPEVSDHIRGVIEAVLFVNERPVTLDQLKKVLPTVTGLEIKNTINTLIAAYAQQNGGMTIQEIAGGYQMLSNSKYASYIMDFYKTRHKEKLSKPALESLAIIAYKQPVTRADIEIIRGVNSDGVAAHLLNKELIKIVGRKDLPGRPYLYGTTKQFLEYFGLKSLSHLPKLEEFPSLQPPAEMEQPISENTEKVESVENAENTENKENTEVT